jgi:ABC-type spermidine/putrescine transport system permease subunit II
MAGYCVAAAWHPYCRIDMRIDVTKTAGTLSLLSHATMIPVQPTSFVMVSEIVPAEDTVSAAARPIRAEEINIVLRTILPTPMPAYFAVALLSPTTEIS